MAGQAAMLRCSDQTARAALLGFKRQLYEVDPDNPEHIDAYKELRLKFHRVIPANLVKFIVGRKTDATSGEGGKVTYWVAPHSNFPSGLPTKIAEAENTTDFLSGDVTVDRNEYYVIDQCVPQTQLGKGVWAVSKWCASVTKFRTHGPQERRPTGADAPPVLQPPTGSEERLDLKRPATGGEEIALKRQRTTGEIIDLTQRLHATGAPLALTRQPATGGEDDSCAARGADASSRKRLARSASNTFNESDEDAQQDPEIQQANAMTDSLVMLKKNILTAQTANVWVSKNIHSNNSVYFWVEQTVQAN